MSFIVSFLKPEPSPFLYRTYLVACVVFMAVAVGVYIQQGVIGWRTFFLIAASVYNFYKYDKVRKAYENDEEHS